MERIEKIIDVNCPVRMVYDQWTQFEEFPQFMADAYEVRQIDDTHVHWHARIRGKDKEWDAEITEQVPEDRISWKSPSGAPRAGTVRFEPLGSGATRVRLVMAYEPEGPLESIGDAIGVIDSRVQHTVEKFKLYVESRVRDTGPWRGEFSGSLRKMRANVIRGGPLGGVGDVWPHCGDA